jgi:hypothetical protein
MRTTIAVLAAGAALAAAPAALSQPTPREQVGMHIGTTVTNGSSTIVTDRWGTHPEGYVGFSPINHAMSDTNPPPREARRHRHPRDVEPR